MRLDRQILAIALPAIVTNITTPLLGLMDVAITGHLGRAEYIAAIAVGGNIFNMLYWIFSFLRSGTSGLTAQAYGARDTQAFSRVFFRSLVMAVALGAAILLCQRPVVEIFVKWMDVTGDTALFTRQYFEILVWGAPAFLCTYSISGWFIGMQDSRSAMWMSLAINVINMAASLLLVIVFNMKIEGVAAGTLIAQWSGLAIGAVLVAKRYTLNRVKFRDLMERNELGRFFRVSRDLFLRTVCLVAVTLWFTRVGASQGTVMLAANTLLMQFFLFFSYFTDGFAYAGEALAGRYIGEKNGEMFRAAVSRLMVWGLGVALLFVAIYGFGGTQFLRLLSDDAGVVAVAADFRWWIVLMPLTGFAAFVYDGVFVGATEARHLLGSMIVSAAIFFGTYLVLFPRMGNHGLWIAFLLYLLARGVYLAIQCRRLVAFHAKNV